jgi:threonine/homoserine/homoserine lactone efflux protein
MNEGLLLGKGFLLGLSVAAPVGPIGLLCIRRSLALGSRYGLVTGLGAATADAFYGVIARGPIVAEVVTRASCLSKSLS